MFDRISKARLKELALLKQKKSRGEQVVFVAEGEKIVGEVLGSDLKVKTILGTKEWLLANKKKLQLSNFEVFEVYDEELARVSNLKTPNKVLVVAEIPEQKFNVHELKNKLTLVLDDIQDPGNLGTIIRLADWFGIENIICSENTVDVYNPKVIQSTMGAFLRVKLKYINLNVFFKEIDNSIPIYGAFLEGKDIYKEQLTSSGIIVMGNESKGISTEIGQFISNKITIPSFSKNDAKTESLNVSVATAIICSEFRREGK
jgi:TrmH family RNA methyltransferase